MAEQTGGRIRVGIVMGGLSSEREVSLESGRNIFSKIGSEPDKGVSKLFDHMAKEVDEYMKKISGYGIA